MASRILGVVVYVTSNLDRKESITKPPTILSYNTLPCPASSFIETRSRTPLVPKSLSFSSSPSRRGAPVIIRSRSIRSSSAVTLLGDFHLSKVISERISKGVGKRIGKRILCRDILFLFILFLFLRRVYDGDRGGLEPFLSWDDNEGYVGVRVEATMFIGRRNLVPVEEVSVEVLAVAMKFVAQQARLTFWEPRKKVYQEVR